MVSDEEDSPEILIDISFLCFHRRGHEVLPALFDTGTEQLVIDLAHVDALGLTDEIRPYTGKKYCTIKRQPVPIYGKVNITWMAETFTEWHQYDWLIVEDLGCDAIIGRTAWDDVDELVARIRRQLKFKRAQASRGRSFVLKNKSHEQMIEVNSQNGRRYWLSEIPPLPINTRGPDTPEALSGRTPTMSSWGTNSRERRPHPAAQLRVDNRQQGYAPATLPWYGHSQTVSHPNCGAHTYATTGAYSNEHSERDDEDQDESEEEDEDEDEGGWQWDPAHNNHFRLERHVDGMCNAKCLSNH